MKKRIVIVFLFFILFVGCVLYLYKRSLPDIELGSIPNINNTEIGKSNDEVSSLNFSEKEKKIVVGDEFSLQAEIESNGKKVSAVELHVSFDPKIVELNAIEPREEFSLVLSGAQIDNEKGVASIVLGVPLGHDPVTDSVAIAVFSFKSLVSGETKVIFSNESVASAIDSPENVVSMRTGSEIVVK